MTKYTHEPGPDIDLEAEDVRDSKAHRITQEYVDGTVTDAHRQIRSRPSLTGPDKRSPQIAFRVPANLQATAEQLAERRGETVSQLAREALEDYVKKAS